MGVDEDRTLSRQGRIERGIKLFFRGDRIGCRPHGLRQLDIVNIVRKDGLGVAFPVKEILPLSNHAQNAVVNNDLDQGQMLPHSRRDLIHVHAEAAVAGNVDYLLVRAADLRSDSRSQTITHSSQSAGSQKLARAMKAVILGRPHLVLSHFRHNNSVSLRLLTDLLDQIGAGEPGLVIGQRKALFGLFHFPLPVRVLTRLQEAIQCHKNFSDISNDIRIDHNILVNLGGIDIDVENFSVPGKGLGISDHTIRETGPDRD